MNARKATLDVAINGNSINENLSDETLSFSYTDNLKGQVDDVALSFEDRTGKWVGGWFPAKGDKLTARLLYEEKALDCGAFTVDECSMAGFPDIVTIKGLAVPAQNNFSEIRRTRTWEKATLPEILRSLAEASGLPFQYRATYSPVLDFVSQVNQSDRGFMKGLCEKYGLGLKLYSNRAVVYDMAELAKAAGVATLQKREVLNYSFGFKVVGTAYTGVVVKYTNSDGEVVEFRHEVEAKTHKLYTYKTPVKNLAEAIRVAEAKLRLLNMDEVTGSVSVDGNPFLVSGLCVEIRGFGIYDGKYLITQATHAASSAGYTTALKLTREGA